MPGVNPSSPFTDPVPVAGSAESTTQSPFADKVDIPTTGHGVGTGISPFAEVEVEVETDGAEVLDAAPAQSSKKATEVLTEVDEKAAGDPA